MINTTTPLMAAYEESFPQYGTLLASDKVKYKRKSCSLSLTLDVLEIRDSKNVDRILFTTDCKTLVGAKLTGKQEKHCIIEVIYYPLSKSCCNGNKHGNARVRKSFALDFGADLEEAKSWINAIRSVVSGCVPFLFSGNYVAAPVQRSFLVVVNPASGKRKALKIWTAVVQPMLREADIKVQLLITEYAQHAKNTVCSMKAIQTNFTAILCVGGDGLVYEVVNGLMARPEDGELVLRTLPIVHIPGGTGNGLAKSVLFASNNEKCTPRNAVFVALRGSPHALDLSQITTLVDGRTHLSFLSFAWGLVSDVDILSETMRCLGEIRLYLAGVYFIARRKYYKGTLRMRLVGEGTSVTTTAATTDTIGQCDTVKNSLLLASDANSTSDANSSHCNNNVTETSYNTTIATDSELMLTNENNNSNSVFTANNSTIADNSSSTSSADQQWLTLEGEFLMVWVVQTSHVAQNMYSGPEVGLDDGVFTVFVVQNISRIEMLQLLIGMDEGQHILHPKVKTYKCTEYILEPASTTSVCCSSSSSDDCEAAKNATSSAVRSDGVYSLDGEVVPYGPVKASLLPSAARVLVLK